MSEYREFRQMSDQQIDTIILAAFASKQKVTITQKDGTQYTGFIHSDFDQDGFSLTTAYIWWQDIQLVTPEPAFYKEWTNILDTCVAEGNSDPFSD